MKQIELYDIITLEDETEYTVIKILENQGKTYLLLAPVDEEEEPNMEEIKIVEEVIENNKIMIQEEEDEERLKELSKLFLSSIRETLE